MTERTKITQKIDEKRTEAIIIRVMPFEKELIERAVRLIAADADAAVSVSAWIRSTATSAATRYLVERESRSRGTDERPVDKKEE